MAFAAALLGQNLDRSALAGRFQFVQLVIESSADAPPRPRNVIGTLTFDGAGGFSIAIDPRSAAHGPAAVSGRYDVEVDGALTFDDPLRTGVRIDGFLSADRMVLAGAALAAPTGSVDLLVAVRVPEQGIEALLDGAYTMGAFELPAADPADLRSALLTFQANGAGALGEVVEVGHRRGVRNARREGRRRQLSLGGRRLVGDRASGLAQTSESLVLFASADGNYVIGAPRALNRPRQQNSQPARPAAGRLCGLYWTATIGFDGAGFHSGVGTASVRRRLHALIARRLRVPTGAIDLSRRDTLTLADEGVGWMSPVAYSGGANVSFGVSDAVFTAGAAAGAGVDAVGQLSDDFGVMLLLLPPLPDLAPGLFVDPRGVVHGASFARPPSPLAPGLLASIFGTQLIAAGGPDAAGATQAPLPFELAGVRVTVNGTPAPLVFVTRAQINFQVPAETPPGVAAITVSNGEQQVTVRRRVALTSPGLFFSRSQERAAAIVSRGDGSLITPLAPARPGETVVFWSTGFGATQPAVPSGVPSPGLGGEPPARPVDPNVALLIAGIPARIAFIGGAPGFIGLTQINATIPLDAPLGDTVPVALLTTNAIQDQSDLPIGGAAILSKESLSKESLKEESTASPTAAPVRVRRQWGLR